VEDILRSRRRGGSLEYLVKWEGFGEKDCSWEPEGNLTNCPRILEAFCRRKRALPLQRCRTMEGDNVMNMTPHSNTAADEALKGVGTRWFKAKG
jgi:hypothetical protein